MTAPLLQVEGLTVELAGPGGPFRIVDDLPLTLRRGEILGVVGESGSGKTVACRALMKLLPGADLSIAAGSVRVAGEEILDLPPARLRAIRGRRIGMIFQNPASHLDPVMSIGDQIAESARYHRGIGRGEARRAAIELLRQVGIPDPEGRLGAYAHEFSGGMRQRAMIALALACDPDILIADEPTTALDVTVQAQILRLLKDLRDQRGLAIIFITHDLGVVAQLCDRICVLYAGRLCEEGTKQAVLANPQHRYTKALLDCQPAAGANGERLRTIGGQPPRVEAMPPGCRFHPRCPAALDICSRAQPPIEPADAAHRSACHNPIGAASCHAAGESGA